MNTLFLKSAAIYATTLIQITYILSTYFENCLLSWFVSQGFFSQQSNQWPTQAALRDKSRRETIFKIMAGRINVSICNVLLSYLARLFLICHSFYMVDLFMTTKLPINPLPQKIVLLQCSSALKIKRFINHFPFKALIVYACYGK